MNPAYMMKVENLDIFNKADALFETSAEILLGLKKNWRA